VTFVFLPGGHALFAERMTTRSGHPMPPSPLDDQPVVLEEPSREPGPGTAEIDQPSATIVAEAVADLHVQLFLTPTKEKETPQ